MNFKVLDVPDWLEVITLQALKGLQQNYAKIIQVAQLVQATKTMRNLDKLNHNYGDTCNEKNASLKVCLNALDNEGMVMSCSAQMKF